MTRAPGVSFDLDQPNRLRGRRVALYARWYIASKQRWHHLVDYLCWHGAHVSVYSPLPWNWSAKNSPYAPDGARILYARQAPVRLEALFPVAAYNRARERTQLRAFVADAADLHICVDAPRQPLPRRPARFIYDIVDEYGGTPWDPGDYRGREQRLCEMADAIWVVSGSLHRRLAAQYRHKIRYVPNGVHFSHLAPAAKERLARKGQPSRKVVGYVGTLGYWFDCSLVAQLARFLADWEVWIVGRPPHPTWTAQFRGIPNIKFLGFRRYDELPRILAAFDVGMIPFKMSELVTATSPIKLYEYLAAGLPVAASPMPEVAQHSEPGVVACAESAETFAGVVRVLDAGVNPERCQSIAMASTWEARFSRGLRGLTDAPPAR